MSTRYASQISFTPTAGPPAVPRALPSVLHPRPSSGSAAEDAAERVEVVPFDVRTLQPAARRRAVGPTRRESRTAMEHAPVVEYPHITHLHALLKAAPWRREARGEALDGAVVRTDGLGVVRIHTKQ